MSAPTLPPRTPTPEIPAARSAEGAQVDSTVIQIEKLSIRYGSFQAIRDVSMSIGRNRVTAIIGPSGCGKSTLLRALNRMNDFVAQMKVEGRVLYKGRDIYSRDVDPIDLRRSVGMVFQKPNPFPKSIYNNVAWGAKINGYKGDMDDLVLRSLKAAALWEEVESKLHQSALNLSGGQQQRLCIARAIALEPDVILMDEPCSALDPIATARIEDLIGELKSRYTVVLVTHNMQQAARVSDKTAFMLLGELVEFDETSKLFTRPGDARTQDYITGRFG
ncbi:MAG: phosphate ABC transporter ATP-binding protein [Phycisphaerales bacterium]|nr:phosphate ABC transporter ATP-binding protein [Phycisphaerales bacterium]